MKQLEHTPKSASTSGSVVLLMSIIALSWVGGFLLGSMKSTGSDYVEVRASFQPTAQAATLTPTLAAANVVDANASTENPAVHTVNDQFMNEQLGQTRAELMRLHAMFVHLADIAELHDGEFVLESPLLEWDKQSNLHNVEVLNHQLAHMSTHADAMMEIFSQRRLAHDQKISGRPIANGNKTSGFGYRRDPISGRRIEHLGLDYSGPVGEPIVALADGVVTFAGKNAGYGNMVELEHVDGYLTRYAHNQSNLVKKGERVAKGDVIATLGSTGRSTGPHVHLEVRLDGAPIDPGFFVR